MPTGTSSVAEVRWVKLMWWPPGRIFQLWFAVGDGGEERLVSRRCCYRRKGAVRPTRALGVELRDVIGIDFVESVASEYCGVLFDCILSGRTKKILHVYE